MEVLWNPTKDKISWRSKVCFTVETLRRLLVLTCIEEAIINFGKDIFLLSETMNRNEKIETSGTNCKLHALGGY